MSEEINAPRAHLIPGPITLRNDFASLGLFSFLRKFYLLTKLLFVNSIRLKRPVMVLMPLISNLLLLISTKSMFPDRVYPQVINPPFFNLYCDIPTNSTIGVYSPSMEDAMTVGEKLSKGLFETDTFYQLFDSKSSLLESLNEDGNLFAGVSLNQTSTTVHLRPGWIPQSGKDTSPIECRTPYQCKLVEYSCLGLIEKILADSKEASVLRFRLFPQPKLYMSGLKASSVLWLLPLYVTIFFCNLFVITLVDLVKEKEQRIRDFLQVNGLNRKFYWLAHSTVSLIYSLFLSAVSAWALKRGNLFPLTPVIFTFLACLLFSSSLQAIAFIADMFLKDTKTASFVGSTIDVIMLIAGGLGFYYPILSRFFFFIPSVPFFVFFKFVGEAEAAKISLSRVELGESLIGSLASLFCSLSLSYFLFIWRSSNGNSARSDVDETGAIQVTNLVKKYYPKTVLKSISLSINQNERVILLGPNSSGKSTLLKLISDLTHKDTGEIQVVDHSVCFQDNIFFEGLTVLEHVIFVSQLHGINIQYSMDLVNKLNLNPQQKPTELSGGEKRRLCLALALINRNTKFIVLDEPTSGVDVEGRKLIWDILRQDGRGFLLTTHYLDEAAALGDRIVILDKGEILRDSTKAALIASDEMTFEIKPSNIITDGILSRHFPKSVAGSKVITSDFEQVLKCAKTLEKQDKSFSLSLRSKTLEAVIDEIRASHRGADATPRRSAARGDRGELGIAGKMTEKIFALSRVRVLSELHSVKSAIAFFTIPFVTVGLSLLSRYLNMFFTRNSGEGKYESWDNLDFSDYSSFYGKSSVEIPIAPGSGSISKFLPPFFTPIEIQRGQSISNFLMNSTYPFAIERNRFWMNPSYPCSVPVVLSFFSNNQQVISEPVLTAMQISLNPTFLSFVIYFVLSLQRISTTSASLMITERPFVKFLRIYGLDQASYFLGTLLGQFSLNVIILLGTTLLGLATIDQKLPQYSSVLILLTVIVNAIQLQMHGYLISGLFKNAETMLKVVPLVSSVVNEGIAMIGIIVLIACSGSDFWISVILSVLSFVSSSFPIIGCFVSLSLAEAECKISGKCVSGLLELFTSRSIFPLVVVTFQMFLAAGIYLLRKNKSEFRQQEKRVRKPLLPSGIREMVAMDSARVAPLRFQNLFHTYDKTKWAVWNFSVDVASGQILALLAPNGSGKTTAISAIVGFLDPTAGRASVSPSLMLGYCPQNDDFQWQKLTVKENIRFFNVLRGTEMADSDGLIDALELNDVADTQGADLSGGMKRRLALAISLIDSPEILILDEPSSGVDIEGKRVIWKLLKSRKSLAAVLLTTHSMEEAEYLADRICIMKTGKVVRTASQDELRREQGYTVQFTQESVASDLEEVFRSHDINPEKTEPGILRFQSGVLFSDILGILNRVKETANLSSFTIAPTSLEDSYLSLTAQQNLS
jgi:ABC-2 type transport system ATP-binding protein